MRLFVYWPINLVNVYNSASSRPWRKIKTIKYPRKRGGWLFVDREIKTVKTNKNYTAPGLCNLRDPLPGVEHIPKSRISAKMWFHKQRKRIFVFSRRPRSGSIRNTFLNSFLQSIRFLKEKKTHRRSIISFIKYVLKKSDVENRPNWIDLFVW